MMSGNGNDDEKLDLEYFKKQALKHQGGELARAKILPVLSFYMKAESLPERYKGIDNYVMGVRKNLMEELNNELTQAQMVLLDGITETLLISRYISAFLAEDLENRAITTDKYGISRVSDLICKGFSNIHSILDKKIKLFSELTGKSEVKSAEEDGYIKAITGRLERKGGKEGRPTNKING